MPPNDNIIGERVQVGVSYVTRLEGVLSQFSNVVDQVSRGEATMAAMQRAVSSVNEGLLTSLNVMKAQEGLVSGELLQVYDALRKVQKEGLQDTEDLVQLQSRLTQAVEEQRGSMADQVTLTREMKNMLDELSSTQEVFHGEIGSGQLMAGLNAVRSGQMSQGVEMLQQWLKRQNDETVALLDANQLQFYEGIQGFVGSVGALSDTMREHADQIARSQQSLSESLVGMIGGSMDIGSFGANVGDMVYGRYAGEGTTIGRGIGALSRLADSPNARLAKVGSMASRVATSGLTKGAATAVGYAAIPVTAAYMAGNTYYNGVLGIGGENTRREYAASIGQVGQGEVIGLQARQRASSMFDMGMSAEQAEAIYGGARRAGFRGESFDQATRFAERQLDRYGMDPAETMAIFDEQVNKAGLSTGQVATQLDTLAAVAADTNASFQELTQAYREGVEGFRQQGFGSEFSAGLSKVLTGALATVPELQGVDPSQIVGPEFINRFAGLRGLTRETAKDTLEEMGAVGAAGAIQDTLRQLFSDMGINNLEQAEAMRKQADMSYGDMARLVGVTGVDEPQARALIESVFSGQLAQGVQSTLQEDVEMGEANVVDRAIRLAKSNPLNPLNPTTGLPALFSTRGGRAAGQVRGFYDQYVSATGNRLMPLESFFQDFSGSDPMNIAVKDAEGNTTSLLDYIRAGGEGAFERLLSDDVQLANVEEWKGGKPTTSDEFRSFSSFVGNAGLQEVNRLTEVTIEAAPYLKDFFDIVRSDTGVSDRINREMERRGHAAPNAREGLR